MNDDNSDYVCIAVGCREVTGGKLQPFCREHWNTLLSVQQDALVDAYRAGQSQDSEMCPSLEWWHAIQSAIGYLAFHEGKWSWAKAQEEIRKIRQLIIRRDRTATHVGPVS